MFGARENIRHFLPNLNSFQNTSPPRVVKQNISGSIMYYGQNAW
jgi:hypothetical protein